MQKLKLSEKAEERDVPFGFDHRTGGRAFPGHPDRPERKADQQPAGHICKIGN